VLASPQLTMPPNGSLSDAYTVGEGEGDGSPSSLRPILLSADAYGDGDAYGYGDGCRLQNMLLSTNWLGVALIHAATVKGAAPIGRFTLAPCAENRHDRPSSITSSISVRMGGTEAKGGNGGGEGGGGNGGGNGGKGGAGTQHMHSVLVQLVDADGDGDATGSVCSCRRAFSQPII
jgi:hypothetical protein